MFGGELIAVSLLQRGDNEERWIGKKKKKKKKRRLENPFATCFSKLLFELAVGTAMQSVPSRYYQQPATI